MQILYGYSNCTDKKYREIVSENNVAVLQPDQKYHGLLIKGLSKNGVKVLCFSGLPINRAVTSKVLIREKDEVEENVHFHYYTTLNIPVIRQLMIFFAAFFGVLRVKRTGEDCIICDCLNAANAFGMVFAGWLKRIKTVLIVTDLPYMQTTSIIRPWLNKQIFKLADGFILLTEQMNKEINVNRKPCIVLEGHVDSNMENRMDENKYETAENKFIIIYAGSLHRLYGIQNLVEGFIKADLENAELHIYGDGDYREELENIVRKHKNIEYEGICSNESVVQAEMKASLLVNPRPSEPEYTKYSFPSKNMEYMVSGTPVLTTKLPGMPSDYYPFVYFVKDESSDGIAKMLRAIHSIPYTERKKMGLDAKRFVLEEKSNVVQSRKIIKFIKEDLEQYHE